MRHTIHTTYLSKDPRYRGLLTIPVWPLSPTSTHLCVCRSGHVSLAEDLSHHYGFSDVHGSFQIAAQISLDRAVWVRGDEQ